jgi:acetyl esterase/lipase
VFAPPGEANGAGIIYMVSGGWVSWWMPPEEARSNFEALLSEGFTVFSIRHGSSPRFKVPEAYADVRRAVRFVRLNAHTYGVDPDRLGVWGGSAGGHLSLMLGLASDKGNPTATDEVLRESSRVAAVVAYFPPVDLRTRVAPHDRFPPTYPDDALSLAGGIVRPDSHTPFPALDFDARLMSSVSPILHVSSDDPPTLLVHGDADSLVDVNNSRLMHTTLSGKGVVTDLVVVEGAGHGFQGADATRATSALVEWFSTHLAEGN